MPIFITDFMLLTDEVEGITSNPNSPRIGIQNSAGRGTIFASPTELPSNPAWLTSTSSTAERFKTSPSTYNLWVANVNGAICDYVGIAATKVTAGSQVDVKIVRDGVLISVYGPAIVLDESPIFIMFEAGEVETVAITYTKTEPFSIEIGIVNVGKTVFLPRNIYVGHTPIKYGRQPSTLVSMSDNMNFLGHVNTGTTLSSSVSMSNIPPDFYRKYIYTSFQIPAETNPFFWAWRPQSYPKEVGFCWLSGRFDVSNESPNGFMSIGFSMAGYTSNGQ